MKTLLTLPLLLALLACSERQQTPADAAPASVQSDDGPALQPRKKVEATPPYIVQEGCDFWLVTPSGVISTRSERGSGPSGQATLSWGGQEMQLADCELIGNPGQLPVY